MGCVDLDDANVCEKVVGIGTDTLSVELGRIQYLSCCNSFDYNGNVPVGIFRLDHLQRLEIVSANSLSPLERTFFATTVARIEDRWMFGLAFRQLS